MKLPPLNCNPVFQDVASNTTMSNIEIPMSKERPPKQNVFSGKKSSSRPDLMAELVPATAISMQSQPAMQSIGSAHNSI